MDLLNWLYLCFGLAALNLLATHFRNRSFLSQTSHISSSSDLDRFKMLARQNMYYALTQIGILGAGNILGIYGLITEHMSLFLIIILNVGIIIIAKFTKSSEKLVQNLTVNDSFLEGQYRTVCDAWMNKALPDF